MALNAFLDLELAVPRPDELADFWLRRGLVRTGDATLGTPERPVQLRLREAPWRHVATLHLGCDDEADLAAIAGRLDRLGLAATVAGGQLRTRDPLGDHEVVVDVTPAGAASVAPVEPAAINRPGATERTDRRSPACLSATPRAPRRVGHAVFGTPDVEASRAFYVDGLGFRISDVIGGGLAYFLRCSTDHHNLLISPAPAPCLNHYALEFDGVDAIALAAGDILAERPDCAVAGLGRHIVGANLFWYLLDPAGGMFELFTDMDQIVDDERWDAEVRRDDWDPFGIAAWNTNAPSPDFWLPTDLDDLVAARDRVRS